MNLESALRGSVLVFLNRSCSQEQNESVRKLAQVTPSSSTLQWLFGRLRVTAMSSWRPKPSEFQHLSPPWTSLWGSAHSAPAPLHLLLLTHDRIAHLEVLALAVPCAHNALPSKYIHGCSFTSSNGRAQLFLISNSDSSHSCLLFSIVINAFEYSSSIQFKSHIYASRMEDQLGLSPVGVLFIAVSPAPRTVPDI